MFLREVYNPSVMCLTFGIAVLGTYLTITFCELLRKTMSIPLPPKLFGRCELIVAMTISMGGIGIFCMHFIGMSSVKLFTSDEEEHVSYNLIPTLVSLVIVLLFSGGGLFVASLDPMFGKTKAEIINEFVSKASKMDPKDLMYISNFRMLVIIATQQLGYLFCGGLITGAGVSVMHYLWMWALKFDDGVIEYNAGIVAASVLIALIASTVAFWILFRLLSLYPELEVLRMTSALLMALGLFGMHFTGMKAARYSFRHEHYSAPTAGAMGVSIGSGSAFYGTLLTALLLGLILFVLAISEQRHRIFLLVGEIKRFTESIEKLHRQHGPHATIPIEYLLNLARSPVNKSGVILSVPDVNENLMIGNGDDEEVLGDVKMESSITPPEEV